jgi:glycyl-tRNA synthetase beta chain
VRGVDGEERVGRLMADFLLELLSEEIPARMQARAAADLVRLFEAELARADVKAEAIESFVTPRRLALLARGLPPATAEVVEELKGPRSGAPPQALDGFLRKTGLAREQLIERDGVLFAELRRPGRPIAALLAEAVPAAARQLPWPKSMRWGAASLSAESPRWVRPLAGVVALLDAEVVPLEVAGIASGRETAGHRFLHAGRVSIASAGAYEETLRAAHVIVDPEERRALVRDGAQAAAVAAGLRLVEDEGLVAENAGLTEWPVPLLGRFDPAFLQVPREVIQLTMRTNQKYFACTDGEGRLAPAFVCTANIAASDGGAAIVAGNGKVLAARLADARFFWDQDRRLPLAEQARKLDQIVFHEKLGTVADKVERVAKLARWLVEEGIVPPSAAPASPSVLSEVEGRQASSAAETHGNGASTSLSANGQGTDRAALADLAEQAARLCKADLVTGMVGEFPELQGIMGGYYARAEGLPEAVADAIRDHYKPVGQGDEVPTAPVTVAVSLADKLDSVVQFFAADMRPSGSKDPFALRRSALGIVALITANGLRLSLADPFAAALGRDEGEGDGPPLLDFFADRLKVQQREAGVRHDLIDAVFALGGEDDLVRLLARVHALQAFLASEDGANLLVAYRRGANILRAEEKKDGAPPPAFAGFAYEPDLDEAGLAHALDAQLPLADAAVADERFEDAMAALAVLRPAVDRFFDTVTVNAGDPERRTARLGLLAKLTAAMHKVADFSRIEG